ncbi:MAG: hypothetical protein V1862_08005 [Methanobacteriota archaeon]
MTETTDVIIKLPELPVIEIVDDLTQVYKEFMVIRAALRLQIFDWMAAHGSATMEEISAGTGIKEEYIASILGMLFYLDLVRKSGDKFIIAPSANLHFVRSSNYYQGDVILALSADDSPWLEIDEYITRPESKTTFERANQYSGASTAEQELRGMVRNVTTVISRWAGFKDSHTFFEFGAGHGLYAIAACQLLPGLKAVVYEKQGSTILQENVTKFNMNGRITACGDEIWSQKDTIFDIILASHSLYPYQENLADQISSIASFLRENGLFVSNHWCNRELEGTGMQGLYELELAIHNRYHMIQNREAYEDICRQNGLDIFQTGMMRTTYGESTIHMAHKQTSEEKR